MDKTKINLPLTGTSFSEMGSIRSGWLGSILKN